MQNLEITIQKKIFNNKEINSVDARELYLKLEIKKQFADWIKDRLEDFEENIDYVCVSLKSETQRRDGKKGASVKKDYILTIETAKHIAMMERNEKGKQIRQYFIDFEEKTKQLFLQQNTLSDKEQALLLAKELINSENRIKTLELTTNSYEKTINAISNTQDTYSFREVAKKLNAKESDLKTFLIKTGIIAFNVSGQKYLPTYKAKEKKYTQFKTIIYHKDNIEKSREEIRYTNIFIEKFLKNQNKFNEFVQNYSTKVKVERIIKL